VIIKYAEGQRIKVGRDLIVGGELISCHVVAKERVRVKGRRGKIIGGEINAGKEIRASILGSPAGTTTVLTVAYDEGLMKSYHEIVHEIERLEADGKRVKETLYNLYKLQIDGKLPPDKQQVLKKLEKFRDDLPQALEALNRKKDVVLEKMKELQDACIMADDTIHPGVQVHFGVVYREITEEVKKRKLIFEGSQILLSEWHPKPD
jgi:hypothetical protein